MEVTRPAFPSPIICIDDFLPADDAGRILQDCIEFKYLFSLASVVEKDGKVRTDTGFRSNYVLYLKQLEQLVPPQGDINRLLRAKIWGEECKRLWHDGEFIFDIINYSNFQSATVSRFGDGEFFKGHRDTTWNHLTQRLVTLVYYVNRDPMPYSGGQLVLSKKGERLEIEPRHNRAVLFPSFTVHEVAPVTLSSFDWGDGRFSLNYWFGFR